MRITRCMPSSIKRHEFVPTPSSLTSLLARNTVIKDLSNTILQRGKNIAKPVTYTNLLYILDRCMAAFISFKICVCGPPEFAATWLHTTDNYTRADLQLRRCEEKTCRHWDRDFWFPHFLYHIILLMIINLVPRAHVPFGQHQDTEPWNNQFPETKILGLPASQRMRGLV